MNQTDRVSDARLREIADGTWGNRADDIRFAASELLERRAADRVTEPAPARYASGETPQVGDVVHPVYVNKPPISHYIVVQIHGTRLRFKHEDSDVWWEAEKYHLCKRGPGITKTQLREAWDIFRCSPANAESFLHAAKQAGIEVREDNT
jgi:hypothetical protein